MKSNAEFWADKLAHAQHYYHHYLEQADRWGKLFTQALRIGDTASAAKCAANQQARLERAGHWAFEMQKATLKQATAA